MAVKKLDPVHPGEILWEEFLQPLGISRQELARQIKVSPRIVQEICQQRRPINADTDLRLGRFFGLSEGFWLRLQNHYDLDVAKDRLGTRLKREVKTLARTS